MLKKLKVPLCIGDKAVFTSPMDKAGVSQPFVVLEDYSVKDGRIEWSMKTDKGEIITGRIKDQQRVPIYSGMWVAVCIPVALHYKPKGLAVDFIFGVPAAVDIRLVKQDK